MRIAKQEPAVGPQPDISPFDAGRECFLEGRSVDVGLRMAGINYKMLDQTASFVRGYNDERRDSVEQQLGRSLDDDELEEFI